MSKAKMQMAIVAAALLLGAGTAHAQYRYWSPYRSWSDNYPFRPNYHREYKKSDSTKKARSRAAAKEATKKEAAKKDTAKGPLLIVISIADQRISLYDNGALIARSSVSTGVKNHPTPVGVFSVISKSRHHRSNIYSGAPMPYMQRITWSGIALHAGDLPGYPASHGCIRLTNDFAIRLWHLTKRGIGYGKSRVSSPLSAKRCRLRHGLVADDEHADARPCPQLSL